MGMRILVCGGRDYRDRDAVFRALDKLHAERGIDAVIQGAADGADRWAEDLAPDQAAEPGPVGR